MNVFKFSLFCFLIISFDKAFACANETTHAMLSERSSSSKAKGGTFRGYLAFMLLCEPDTHCVSLAVKSDIIRCMETGQSMAALYLYKQCTAQGSVTCDDSAMAKTIRGCLRLQGRDGNLITDSSRECIRQKVTLGHLDCYKINQRLRVRGEKYWSNRPPGAITPRPDVGALFTSTGPPGYGYNYVYRTTTRPPEVLYQPYPPPNANSQPYPPPNANSQPFGFPNPNQAANYPPAYPQEPPFARPPIRNQEFDDSDEEDDEKDDARPLKRRPSRNRRPQKAAKESSAQVTVNAKQVAFNRPTRRTYAFVTPSRRAIIHRGFPDLTTENPFPVVTSLTEGNEESNVEIVEEGDYKEIIPEY